MVAVFMEDMARLPMLAMGTASLANILEAEENTQAINDSVYGSKQRTLWGAVLLARDNVEVWAGRVSCGLKCSV